MAGEDLVEDDAEEVDVGDGGDGLTAELFGAGVLGRHETQGGGGVFGGGGGIGGEDLGDAEVEEFRGAVGFDEDVSRFEVAVDDEVLVGVVDGRADVAEDTEAIFGGKFLLVAEGVDGVAFDVLHDEVRTAIRGGAAIEEPGDVGVVEGGDDLSFAAEALDDAFLLHAEADDFEGDELGVVLVGAGGEIDGSHASGAELALDGIRADVGGVGFVGLAVCFFEELGDGGDGGMG